QIAIPAPPYTLADATAGLFLSEAEFLTILNRLKHKKNIILQGAPGVGKTYVAKRLGFALMGEKDESRLAVVQFHQSYSYEDFIHGFRPTRNGSFELRYGPFFRFCESARENPS